jgi:hypothetical protein
MFAVCQGRFRSSLEGRRDAKALEYCSVDENMQSEMIS